MQALIVAVVYAIDLSLLLLKYVGNINFKLSFYVLLNNSGFKSVVVKLEVSKNLTLTSLFT